MKNQTAPKNDQISQYNRFATSKRRQFVQVDTLVASVVGFEAATIIGYINNWCRTHREEGKEHRESGGHYWHPTTVEKMRRDLPWWSLTTLRRYLAALESSGVLKTTRNLNNSPFDRAYAYRIDTAKLTALVKSKAGDKARQQAA